MSEIQALLADWISGLAAVLPFGFAFGAGMIAAVNPCGFAMLPAYLSLYLGAGDEGDFAKHSAATRLLRALLVAGCVSLGFIFLFGAVGLVISAGGNALLGAMPLVGILVGVALILLGLWMLAGQGGLYTGVFERLAAKLGNPKTVSMRGFFLFGLAYGAASLSCTLPVFLAVVAGGITASGGAASGTGQFFSYALGMGSVLVVLTLALALFKQGLVTRLRKLVPYVQTASAVLLVLAGAYIVFYWWSAQSGAALPG